MMAKDHSRSHIVQDFNLCDISPKNITTYKVPSVFGSFISLVEFLLVNFFIQLSIKLVSYQLFPHSFLLGYRNDKTG